MTYRDLFIAALLDNHESWKDVIAYSCPIAFLNAAVDDRPGPAVHLWTREFVYSLIFFNEAQVTSAPRNPGVYS